MTISIFLAVSMAVTALPFNIMAQDPIYGGTLTTPLGADAHTLNPLTWGTTYEAFVLGHLYDALVQYDMENVPQNVLAKAWEYNSTLEKWIFTVVDNAFWHDGVPLTIDDVYFTYNLLWNDPAIPRRSWMFDEIVSLTVLNTTSLQIEFGYGPRPADVLLDLATTWILPEHIWESVADIYNFANDAPVGCGPFSFVEWVKGSFFRLAAHDDYHLGRPYIDFKVLQIISNVETGYYALSTGDIETLGSPPPELEAVAEVDPDIEVHKFLNDYWMYLGLNQRRYPNNIVEFRKAVLTGINRSEIIEISQYGRGIVAPASCSLPYGEWYNPVITEYDYSVANANAMLDALGWVDTDLDDIRETDNGTVLEFELVVSADAQESVDSCRLIQEYMLDLGIDVTVNPILWDVLWPKVGGNGAGVHDYDWCYLGWVGFWSDRHPNWASWLFNKDGWWGSDDVNIPGWNSTISWQVSNLTQEIIYEQDINIVHDKLDLVQELIAADLPYLPVHFLGGVTLYRIDEFKGWVMGPTAGPDNWETWISVQLINPPAEDTAGFGIMMAVLSTAAVIGFARRRRK